MPVFFGVACLFYFCVNQRSSFLFLLCYSCPCVAFFAGLLCMRSGEDWGRLFQLSFMCLCLFDEPKGSLSRALQLTSVCRACPNQTDRIEAANQGWQKDSLRTFTFSACQAKVAAKTNSRWGFGQQLQLNKCGNPPLSLPLTRHKQRLRCSMGAQLKAFALTLSLFCK